VAWCLVACYLLCGCDVACGLCCVLRCALLLRYFYIVLNPPTGRTRRNEKLKGAPSDKTEDMCKEAANYYMWLFQEIQSIEPEPLLEKLKEKTYFWFSMEPTNTKNILSPTHLCFHLGDREPPVGPRGMLVNPT